MKKRPCKLSPAAARDAGQTLSARSAQFELPASCGVGQTLLSALLHRRGARCGILWMAALALGGCAAPRETRPVWLVNPQSAWPADRYLAAVGEGDSRRAAENSAAAGLARIFESTVQATETLAETTTERRGAASAFDQFSELRSAVQIGAEQTLLNVQYGESFTDARGRVHVAAYIPRAATAAIYTGKIEALARETVFLIRQSAAAPDPVGRYAFLRAAVRKAAETAALMDQLRIIHPGAHAAVRLGYEPEALYASAAAAAQSVTFAVRFPPGAARDALTAALTAMGFTEQDRSPALEFSGTASFEETDIRRGALVFMRWTLNVEMRDRSGRTVMAFQKSSREGHITFEEARARAQRTLQAEAGALLRAELGRYLDRLTSG